MRKQAQARFCRSGFAYVCSAQRLAVMRMQTGSPAEVVTAEPHPVKEGHQLGPESTRFGRSSAQDVFQVSLSLKTDSNLHAPQGIGTEPDGLHLMLLTETFEIRATPMGDVMGRPLTRFEGPPAVKPLPVRNRNHQMPARSHQSGGVSEKRHWIRNVLHHLEGGDQ